MICAIHQPQYAPWLGYFDKMDQADVFCYLDNVQYKKNEWQNRNRIRTAAGWQWITVPVHYRFGQTIDTVMIDNRSPWARKHLQALRTNYGRAPFFDLYFGALEAFLASPCERLSELNISLVELLRRQLGIQAVKTCRASAMTLPEHPTDRLIGICRQLGADTYLAGADGAGYMDLARFARAGIRVGFQRFAHPVYPQCFAPFESHLAVLDLLFNRGPESLASLRSTRPRLFDDNRKDH